MLNAGDFRAATATILSSSTALSALSTALTFVEIGDPGVRQPPVVAMDTLLRYGRGSVDRYDGDLTLHVITDRSTNHKLRDDIADTLETTLTNAAYTAQNLDVALYWRARREGPEPGDEGRRRLVLEAQLLFTRST